MPAEPSSTWLVIGHGSVGGSLTRKLDAAGATVLVYDPRPRVGVETSKRVARVRGRPAEDVGYIAICVPGPALADAAAFVRAGVQGRPVVFDWTSALPASKVEASALVAGPWVDVALLDSLDKQDDSALLAVSGPEADRHLGTLQGLGFEVVVVGSEIGQAAGTKLIRSLFMKGLEALVMEARSFANRLDSAGTAWRSVERNLGSAFAAFADLLVVTDVTHAGRRSVEIGEAVEFARAVGLEPLMGEAARGTLVRLRDLWQDAGEEATDAGIERVLHLASGAFSSAEFSGTAAGGRPSR